MKSAPRRLPLEGIRVIDLGQIFSVPYAATLLAELGADVIKIEGPNRVDVTRVNGVYADADPGPDPWNRISMVNVVNRGKRSLVLDLQTAEGRAILRELIGKSDVLMENFTPRVMKQWGLDYASLATTQPGLIMVSNTGYGQGNGPYADYPAQATTQEATHGLAHVTGYADGPPSKAGASYIDFLAASACVSGVALALRQRRRNGRGQWIDVGMYQIGCFTVGEAILDWRANGRLGGRIGNRHPWLAPQGCYPCAGADRWCVLTVRDARDWSALCALLDAPDLLADHPDQASRHAAHDLIDARIAAWTRTRQRDDAVTAFRGAGLPAAAVADTRDLHHDPHLRARGFQQWLDYPEARGLGSLLTMGLPWGWGAQRPAPRAAPAFGEHNHAILTELLGYDAARCADLEARGIIAPQPAGQPLAAHADRSMAEQVALGLFRAADQHYRKEGTA